MKNTDARIDAYIEKSAEFARPILNHIRNIVHEACPEIEETMKWSMPFFDYKGTVCNMAAFKQHCALGFWKASLMKDPHNILTEGNEAMGQLGKITRVEDLPPDGILIDYIKEAVRLNEEGVKAPSKPKTTEKKVLVIPEYFVSALEENASASEHFEKFSPSKKKDYVEWISEAKTEDTRNKRLATAIEWIAEGKARNWKYERK
jgi:uncharacterized protein YdeI (YjbR/CyaY-like superfamily)